jgi:long-chain acyl-CoA synthetase
MFEAAMAEPISDIFDGQQDPSLPPRLITDLLDNAVALYPDRIAIDFLGRTWTYGEIGGLVQRAARGLQDQGLKKGDRSAFACPIVRTSLSCILPHSRSVRSS